MSTEITITLRCGRCSDGLPDDLDAVDLSSEDGMVGTIYRIHGKWRYEWDMDPYAGDEVDMEELSDCYNWSETVNGLEIACAIEAG